MFSVPAQPSPSERVEMLGEHWRGSSAWHAEQFREGYIHPSNGRFVRPGGYHKRKGAVTPRLEQHAKGLVTLGQYQIDESENVHWLCADADDEKWAAAETRVGLDWLHSLGIQPTLEESSPGRVHLWMLLSAPLPAEVAHRFGLHYKAMLFKHFAPIIRAMSDSEVLQYPAEAALITEPAAAREWLLTKLEQREFFPKQPHKDKKGFGNLVRLPWSLHQVKQTWSRLLSPVIYTNSPLKFLFATAKLDRENPDPLKVFVRAKPARNIFDRPKTTGRKYTTTYEQRKARIEACDDAISVQQLAAQMIGIPLPRSGEKVACPFHSAADGSSGSDAFQVGGHTAQNVMWCWSTNCRTYGHKLTRLKFVQEILGTDSVEDALIELEHQAGLG